MRGDGRRSMIQPESKSLRIIIIDDEPDWQKTLEEYAKFLEHRPDVADSLVDAKIKINEAEKAGDPYSVALLDMNFEVGKSKIPVPQGTQVIKYLKTHHPYIACVMVSGSAAVTPDFVLDLRDEYDLDYFLEKQHISDEILSKAIQRATRRISPIGDSGSHTRVLSDSLERWKRICYLCENNLARVKEKEAIKGIDVDTATLHEIDRYKIMISEARMQIIRIQEELSLYEKPH
jgi:CheY-like chemotaxis protein